MNGLKGDIRPEELGTPSQIDEVYKSIIKTVEKNETPEIPVIGLFKWLEKYNFKKEK